MRILFMGTPAFAVASLAALWEAGHEVCGVFTQPDRPKNRGMKLIPTPVKEYALTKGIPVFQPAKLRDGTAMETIRALAPHMIVVAAYGRILPDEILNYPPKGCINVHASLLPKYRGAAPINWAILNGETETGITIMHMATELDAGDMCATQRTEIGQNETALELYERLSALGGTLLLHTIWEIEEGRATRTPQNHAAATYAPMLTRALSDMDWTRSAQALHNQVRGLLPWPAAVTELGGVRCKILAAEAVEALPSAPPGGADQPSGGAAQPSDTMPGAPSDTTPGGTPDTTPGGTPDTPRDTRPGAILQADDSGIYVNCGIGVLRIKELQPDGKRAMSAADFLRGRKVM